MYKKLKKILCVLLIVFFSLSLIACNNNNSNKGKCNKENYDKIVCAKPNFKTSQYEGGMSISEVKKILGSPTEITSETRMNITVTVYTWKNEDKQIIVSFADKQAIEKYQLGLS